MSQMIGGLNILHYKDTYEICCDIYINSCFINFFKKINMSKKFCVFTQTYGNDREELYKYHNLDELDIYFRNSFDLNLYAFHNVSEEMRNKLLSNSYFSKIDNLEVVVYDNISYTHSWKETMKKLKDSGIDKVIFIQDDCFTITTKEKMDALIEYIKNGDYKLLNIERHIDKFKTENKNVIYDNIVKVYDTTSGDYDGVGYSFDDGPYVGDIDFLSENVYDDTYYSAGGIWGAEMYLHEKMLKNIIQRYVTSCPSHLRYYILGMNSSQRNEELERLEETLRTVTNH